MEHREFVLVGGCSSALALTAQLALFDEAKGHKHMEICRIVILVSCGVNFGGSRLVLHGAGWKKIVIITPVGCAETAARAVFGGGQLRSDFFASDERDSQGGDTHW